MPALTQEQTTRARLEKKRYLLSVLLLVCVNGINVLLGAFYVSNAIVSDIVDASWVAALGFGMVTTWRFCRSMNIGIAATGLAMLLAPFCFIIEVVVLLRVYARRTGLSVTFFMRDKEPQQSKAT